jgi:hypothetical protein
MLDKPARKVRKDKGTHRNNRDEDKTYAFRLRPDKPDEMAVIRAIDEHLDRNKGDSIKTIVMTCIGERLGKPLTREAEMSETLDQQIDRLASAIDKLLSLNLQRGGTSKAPPVGESTSSVDVGYLERIQQTLRGGKK